MWLFFFLQKSIRRRSYTFMIYNFKHKDDRRYSLVLLYTPTMNDSEKEERKKEKEREKERERERESVT